MIGSQAREELLTTVREIYPEKGGEAVNLFGWLWDLRDSDPTSTSES